MSLISIIIPVYNEEGNLLALFDRMQELPSCQGDEYEYIFVDDGSSDSSRQIVKDLAKANANVKYVFFSRNFGHEMATTAGIDYADGDAVVMIDADLQDPPEVIPKMIEKWRQGYSIVCAKRQMRKDESALKRFTSWSFYRLIRLLSDVDIPADTGDFRLMDRCVVTEFRQCREQNRFVRGLVAWTGFKQTSIPYDRDSRYQGKTKYNYFKLLKLGFDAILGFSTVPLRLGMLAGLVVSAISFVIMCMVVFQKLFMGIAIEGYALLTSGMFLLGGIQLFVIGLLGSYVGRIYRQEQNRPLYVVSEMSENKQSQ